MLDDEHLKQAVENAVTNSYCVDLLKHLIDKSGCFRTGLAKDERQEIYNRGYESKVDVGRNRQRA